MTEANRAALLAAATLVRPALAKSEYVPALTHIQFRGGFATAYNDTAAIAVSCPPGIERCVPGELLIKALGAFSGATLAITLPKGESGLQIQSGRSKVKLPTLPAADFPFDSALSSAGGTETELSPAVLAGIDRCLISVGSDEKHPATMGVTLEAGEGSKAVLYSTDNVTITRVETAEQIRAGTLVILPTFFCEQLLSVRRSFPSCAVVLVQVEGALFADFVDEHNNTQATVFHRMLVDPEPLDYPGIFARHVDPSKVDLKDIPDALDAALGRALLVLGTEPVKVTKVKTDGKVMYLTSTSALGDAADDVDFASRPMDFKVDPALIVRGLKAATKMALLPRGVALAGPDGFLHLVANVEV